MAPMKAMLERLVKESDEKEVHIKLQEVGHKADQKVREAVSLIPRKKLRK